MVFFMTIYVSNNSLAFLLFTGQVVSLLKLQSERRDCGNVLTSSPCAEPPLRSPPPLAPASLSSRSAQSWPPGSRSRVAPAGGGSCAAWSPPSASTAEEWTPHLKWTTSVRLRFNWLCLWFYTHILYIHLRKKDNLPMTFHIRNLHY